MNVFFSIFGFVFITAFAIVTEYLYEFFPINKITNFFKPTTKGTWSKVNATILPIILWSCIATPILIKNSNFLISVVLNIFVSCSVLYVIRFVALVFKKENHTINIISIVIATLLGQLLNYLVLLVGKENTHFYYSLIGIIALLFIYVSITLYPPQSSFFRGE